MKALNRNQEILWVARCEACTPSYLVCWLRSLCRVAAQTAPVAVVQPQGDLDSMAYGQAYAMAPAPMPVAYAAASSPVAYDAAYRLDAGDKLRVVVYGQEGLTNSYAIDAGGSITMPLIGSVPARGRTPQASPRRSPANCVAATFATPRCGGDRGLPAVLHSG